MTETAATMAQSPFTSFKKLSCTQCGGELELYNRRAQYVSCQYCGAVLDLNSETYRVIQQLTEPKSYPPFSFIELGVELELFGIRYIVIGRTRWESNYREYYEEYDEDELEKGYSDEVWEYDEWLLLSQYNNYIYLIEDKKHFAISASVVPTAPNLPKTFAYKNINFIQNGAPGLTQEYGRNKILYFEGESTYLKKKGEVALFAMYQKMLSKNDNLIGLENIPLQKFYGVTIDCVFEWRMDSQRMLKEIEFFIEIPISKELLRSAIKVISGDAYIKQAGYINKLLNLRLLFFILTLGFAALALFSVKSHKVTSKQFRSNEVDTTLKPLLSVALIPNNVYELELRSDKLDDPIGRDISLVVTDEHNRILNNFACAFWYETGEDCDSEGCETYIDSNLQNSFKFKVDKPSKITIHAIQSLESSQKNPIALELSLYNIVLSRYFLLGLLIFGTSLLLLHNYLKSNYWWHPAFKGKEN
jgi:ribosomal protein S27E